jgi:hypothetical protein
VGRRIGKGPRIRRLTRRRRAIVGGSLTLAVAVAGGVLACTVPSGSGSAEPAATKGFRADVGAAGPLGPKAFSLVPSYFQRVTFDSRQLGQFQDIHAHLPAGKYLVKIETRGALNGTGPDCMGVSFPLAQSVAGGKGFRGYVSVARDGDATTVSCYQQAAGPTSTATYELFYIPIIPKSAKSKEHA